MEKCGVGETLFYKVIKRKKLKETSEGLVLFPRMQPNRTGGRRCWGPGQAQADADQETGALRRCRWAAPVRPDGRGSRSEDPTLSRTGLETVGHDTRHSPRIQDGGQRDTG